jgi:phenylpropionate dioxygenase-like ring-hydroxylating dioxygenase large terminal subunit
MISTVPSLSVESVALTDLVHAGVDRGLLPLGLFGDPSLYTDELQNIFNRSWVFVAHESELSSPGDFVRRQIGDGAWIITRDKTGGIHALFDSCRHRGAQVCRADSGSSMTFRCPYHGWTFRNDGTLVGVPFHAQAFKTLDYAEWSLFRAPHVESYHGLIFVSLDPQAAPLRSHLGDFAWYLDIHLKMFTGGWEVAGPPSRWIIPANWKSGAENSAGDSYHTVTLHRSLVEMGLIKSFDNGTFDVHITECGGHSMMMRRNDPETDWFFGHPASIRELMNSEALSPDQWELARRGFANTGTVFPNLSFLHQFANDDSSKLPVGTFSIAQWQPKSATETEVIRWILVPKEAPIEYKERSATVSAATFGPAGYFEQDDMIVWGGIARAGQSTYARSRDALLNYEMGLPGMSEATIIPDWPGPGVVYNSRLEEGVMRTFYRTWLRWMTGQ